MAAVARYPLLVFGFVVEALRGIPGARFVAPLLPWFSRLLLLGALLVTLLWMAEASPQRISLSQLAAGELSHMQSWVRVEGDVTEEPGSTPGSYRYRLTDPAAPNAHLDVRSSTAWPTGRTTLSGRVTGGADGVPAGYRWSAILRADDRLADELPPPWTAFAMAGLGTLMILARRTSYPMFETEQPADVAPAPGSVRVLAHGERGSSIARAQPALLHLAAGAALGELRIMGGRPLAVRLHSAFTSVDVGALRSLFSLEPALRVRAADDDVVLGFESRRDRDAAFATMAAGAQGLGVNRPA